ncbi:sugar transferase, partial [Campylobacter coli]
FVSNDFKTDIEEHHQAVRFWINGSKWHNYVDLISILIVHFKSHYYNAQIDFETLANENIEISKEYDFGRIIPPIELYKEIIDEYCAAMDPRKLAPLKKQINDLNNEKQRLEQEKNKQIQVLSNEKNLLQNRILKL